MSTSNIGTTNIRHMPIINFDQEMCNDFELAEANINNAELNFDGDIEMDNWSYIAKNMPSIATKDGVANFWCSYITDAQMCLNARAVYYDEDDNTKNYVVINQEADTPVSYAANNGRHAFCGIMGSTPSGNMAGNTIRQWSDNMKQMFDQLCRWVGSSDRRLR